MNLTELTTKLQTLCHEGHSLDEVLIDGSVITNIKTMKHENMIVINLEKEENAQNPSRLGCFLRIVVEA